MKKVISSAFVLSFLITSCLMMLHVVSLSTAAGAIILTASALRAFKFLFLSLFAIFTIAGTISYVKD